MMRRTILPFVSLLISIAAGCGKSKSVAPSAPNSESSSPSTQPATTTRSEGALGIPPNAPQVGLRPGTEADYKPIVGKYGGRIVRHTLGEPKSLNPITVGETRPAQDVVFTYNDLVYDSQRPPGKEPRWPCSARDSMTFEGKPLNVTAPDDYTVQFVTPVKCAIMDQMAGHPILSRKKYEALAKNGTFGGAMSADSKP